MSDDHQESLDLFDDHEEVVSEDGKKVTRKGIYLLPNLLTTASLFSGFFSIVSAINGNFIASGMALFAAQMLDGLDGRVARLTNSQSLFGAQYDSLCDVISFGLAPAIIVFLWGLDSIGQTGWVFSFFYVAAAALRLARFNLTKINEEEEWKSNFFEGIPSPAGGLLILMPLIYELTDLNTIFEIKKLTPFLTILVAILLVSKIPTLALKKISVSPKTTVFLLLGIGIVFISLLFYTLETLLIFGICYLISIFIKINLSTNNNPIINRK